MNKKMRNYLIPFIILTFSVISSTTYGEALSGQDVPEAVHSYMQKKHPKAEEITIAQKTYFNIPLYEVTFTEEAYDKDNKMYKAKFAKLFRLNGHFYTNAIEVQPDAFNIITDAAEKSLRSHYPDYQITGMKIVSNPNGVGEEYEINLLNSGKSINVNINDKGKIISETVNP